MNQINKNTEQINLKEKGMFLPILPLKNLVALPKSILPVVVGRTLSIKAVDASLKQNKEVFLTAQKLPDVENPKIEDLFVVGTRAIILQTGRLPNGTYKLLIEGISRSKITSTRQADGFLEAEYKDLISTPLEDTTENKALWRNLYDLFKEYVNLNEKIAPDVLAMFRGLPDLDYLADTIAVQIPLDFKDRQEILEIVDLKQRAIRLSVLLKKEIEVLHAEKVFVKEF